MLSIFFALIGLLVGGVINVLADDLPLRVRPRRPHCPRCLHAYAPAGWLAAGRRLLYGNVCPNCGLPTEGRALFVEIGTAFVFALLPLLVSDLRNLIIYSFYIAVLILIIVIDLEHRLILHVVTFPTTVLALIASLLVPDNTILLALLGAITGFVLFYGAYWFGHLAFGPGALGFGDVTLAMTIGAMLGFPRIIFALVIGILLGGLASLLLILSGRYSLRSRIAYGPYLAIAGILMLIWGYRVLDWYTN